MADPAPQREAIQTALERLLAWPEIVRSPQLGRFLNYIVERTLAGDEQSIKAYSIAVDVFGRPADFDPQADPIVRVQARRLRALLEDYYRGAGVSEAVQIRLPVGRYIPEFTLLPDVGPQSPDGEGHSAPRRLLQGGLSFSAAWFLLALIAVGLAMAAYAVSRWGPVEMTDAVRPPAVTVVEFQDLANDGASPPQVAGLAVELVTDLQQFGTISAQYGGGGIVGEGASTRGDFVLTGIVRPDRDFVQYSAILTETGSGEVVWNHTLAVPREQAAMPDVLDTVSRSLSLPLGSPRGPLHAQARLLLAAGTSIEGGATPYLCRVLFDLYRETGSAQGAGRAHECFLALPEAEQSSPMVLAATASLMSERPDIAQSDGTSDDVQQLATSRIERAIARDPLSSFVWEQQGRMAEARGDIGQARAAYSSAVQVNPANSDALAAFARLLALEGNLDEAESMARNALKGQAEPPAWYMAVPALVALREGDFEKALTSAERYAQADHELGPILAIMAAQQLGGSAVTNRYLPQILDAGSFRAVGIIARLRERIGDEALIASMHESLIRAGVPVDAL